MPFTVKKIVPPRFATGDLNVATPFVPVVTVALPDTNPDHDPETTAPATTTPLLSLTVTDADALRLALLLVFTSWILDT
jgi:hypothetical protein